MTDKRVVHLVDDEEAIRKSAGFVLRTSGYDVTSYASGVEFLKEAQHAVPGCVLLDLRMPDLDGLQVQDAMRERGLTLPVIMLTGHGEVSVAVRAMQAGAVDFIEKPFTKATLVKAVEMGMDRLDSADRRLGEVAEAELRVAALTDREREVLSGLARGLPNKAIGYDLDISPRTVEVHRANLMAKLNVRSFSEALRIAFAAQLPDGS